ncbi:beta strand repeat-containing protein [Rhodobacter capsulatus]|uniref:beta strand repeat-containing protein n=1 Tax=Rhodobacter capsulatus TaxID=1061 RepID=UPI0018E3E0EB|nr:VWA domain-containing protein [Rhodobacter capsulatus]
MTGTFTIVAGAVVSGTVTGLAYNDGGVARATISGLSLDWGSFETMLSEDDFPALLQGDDDVRGGTSTDVLRGYDGNDRLYGGANADQLWGGAGDDRLDGGTGSDILSGGSGNDTYVVDSLGDTVVEFRNGGFDTVETRLGSYTLAENIEAVVFVGAGGFTGTGNAADNSMTGGAGADLLSAGAGADTLSGGNGNDTLIAGEGDDLLVGDANGQLVTTTSSGAVPGGAGLNLSLTATLPEISATATTTISGYVNNTATGVAGFDIAFVLDVSNSMHDNQFAGTTVGDVNGDGAANTRLDAAIVAFETLVQAIAATGLGDAVRIGLIPFWGQSEILAAGTATQDLDHDGVADIIEAAYRLRAGDSTGYAAGLAEALAFFGQGGSGAHQVVFLSDGEPTDAVSGYAPLLDQLRDPAGLAATIRALGLGATGGYYDRLDWLDDGVLNGSAIAVADPAGLTAGLLDAGVSTESIAALEIWRDGVRVARLSPDALVSTPLGLSYSVTIPGLATTGSSLIETRLVLNDATGTVISTTQRVTVGAIASNDSLVGGGGNDTLDGGAGNDTLVGGTGDDLYHVDSTTDTIVETATGGRDTIESSVSYTLNRSMTAAIETLRLTGDGDISATGNARANLIEGNGGDNILEGLGGNDTLVGWNGIDTASYRYASYGVTASLAGGWATLAGGETDTLQDIENLVGSAYADDLEGDGGNNVLSGLAGNDTLSGGYGFDLADYSGTGSAVTVLLDVGYRRDSGTSSRDGTDLLQSIEGAIGSRFNDTLSAEASYEGVDNWFDGGAGNDSILGGFGDDTIIGGAGNDTMSGGGDSRYLAYVDVVDYSGATSAIRGTLSGVITGAATGTDVLSGFERIIATDYNDSLTGGAANEVLVGRAGNDTLLGAAGNDTLDGGTGTDSLVGGFGDDLYRVDSTGDILRENAEAGSDRVETTVSFILGLNIEDLTILASNGVMGTGNTLSNVIRSGAGSDRLAGLGGNDTLIGGNGDDTLLGGSGADSLDGGDGIDWIDFSDLVTAVSGTLESWGTASFVSGSGTDIVSNVENILGSAYGDSLTGTDYGNTILGGLGIDTIDGDSGDDSLSGDGGNDLLAGSYGNDTLAGGLGNDLIDGGSGYDLVSYAHLGVRIVADLSTGIVTGEGRDTLVAGTVEHVIGTAFGDGIAWSGANATYVDFILNGGAGNDTLTGSWGDDVLIGGTGADRMNGGRGADTFFVDAAGDVVIEDSYAYDDDDLVISTINYTLGNFLEHLTLSGAAIRGTGNFLDNQLVGNEFGNTLTGLAGNDTIIGGLGRDTMDAGIDGDRDDFVFTAVADSAAGAADLIRNFNVNNDRIILSGIDANILANYDNSFTYIGGRLFTGTAGQLRYEHRDGATLVMGDIDGDRQADLEIELSGELTLTGYNFYL